jgi:Bacterial archaeo-eukaryotic release factor family 3
MESVQVGALAVVDQVLAGSPEELGPHELHARAWAVVEPLFLQGQREAAAKYHQLAGSGLTSRDPREIIRAVKEGRVETLFADRRQQHERQPVAQRRTGAARRARGDRSDHAPQGGTVYALPAGTVPGDGSAAAVFRYSAPVSAGSDQLNGKEK